MTAATAPEMNVEQLRHTALGLPLSARAYLAEALIESLDKDDAFTLPVAAVNEAERRAEAIDQGRAETIPLADALLRLRRSRA